MKDLMFWLMLAGGEVLLLLFVLLLVYWIRHSAMARRDRQAIARLISAVRAGRAEREAAIGRFLAERMGLQGAELDRVRVAMVREELGLLQRFATVYRDRDAGSAAQFHIALQSALAPWFELHGGGAAGEASGTDDSELEALRQENKRLSEELSVTMETMSRMLSEYSSMFADSDPAPEAVPSSVEEVGHDAVSGEPELPARPAAELDTEMLDIGEGEDAVPVQNEEKSEATATEAVEPEGIDELFADEPLAQDLGGLFDDDELAALDASEADAEVTDGEPEKAIVI
ncbi:hypothetical protein [endosymbiont of unidentified scaly snail isolate Monju]|uniref:hypothetical protein n=1 Tax=endosymbiont of unidentified scaly snail isolate Monju TaxID=1248727 RepID=UPI0003891E3B|nr:hypothetical protein [endosymbiont of unidentified scaly snail isolate Monju]BAN69519.1 hypothetical protein EBS_1639 [endosymbiont of unidentified scaly snail isolate Monju]